MRPWAHHNARLASPLAQQAEGIEIAFHIVVVPAADGIHGHANIIDVLADAAALPESIVGGMIRDELPQRQSRARSSAVGLAHGKRENIFAEVGSAIARGAHVLL